MRKDPDVIVEWSRSFYSLRFFAGKAGWQAVELLITGIPNNHEHTIEKKFRQLTNDISRLWERYSQVFVV